VPFRKPRKARKRRGWGFSPIMVALPLAAFTAVFMWGGGPPGWAAIGSRSVAEPAGAGASRWPARDPDAVRKLEAAQGPEPGAALAGARGMGAMQDPEVARFGTCAGRLGQNCVIDGDSLRYQGRQIRIADIDAPELGSPKCDAEYQRGLEAEARLQQLLNAGPFSLEPADSARDRHGRELFIVSRGGQSLGGIMQSEGLAHPWVGHKLPWC
jgi:endonuclease YncB( thermonuclease family)